MRGSAGSGYLEFALVGVPLTVGVILIAVLLGERLLPERRPRSIAPDFSGHARTLIAQYELDHSADELMTRRSGVAEVVIPPRSALAGDRVFPGMTTPSGDLAILAVQRGGDDTGPGETVLAEGDTLLLQGTWAALDSNLGDGDVLVVDAPDVVRRQAVPLGAGARSALVVLFGMVLAL